VIFEARAKHLMGKEKISQLASSIGCLFLAVLRISSQETAQFKISFFSPQVLGLAVASQMTIA
jgi:hypothetical protein